jgi:DNA ligase-1
MDGVRVYWNGTALITKQGNTLSIPVAFTEKLPGVPLDGELWLGRGKFETLIRTVKCGSGWHDVKFFVFDLPASPETFEYRMNSLKQLTLPPHVVVVEFHKCQGIQHLNSMLDNTLSEKGEGLMAVQPLSTYTVGRTPSFLKIEVILSNHSQTCRGFMFLK